MPRNIREEQNPQSYHPLLHRPNVAEILLRKLKFIHPTEKRNLAALCINIQLVPHSGQASPPLKILTS
jgi:hypothetical protein